MPFTHPLETDTAPFVALMVDRVSVADDLSPSEAQITLRGPQLAIRQLQASPPT